MIISQKYELLRQLTDQGVKTHEVRHASLGHTLWLHLLEGGETPDNVEILVSMRRLPQSRRRLFIDAGDHAGTPYLVTWPLPDFDGLLAWLRRELESARTAVIEKKPAAQAAPNPPVPPKVVPDAATTAGNSPAEFTQFFGFEDATIAPPANPSGRAAPPSEFTGFFGSRPTPEAVLPEPPRSTPSPVRDLGDFSRIFGQPSLESDHAPAPPNSPAPGSGGDFTRLFGAPGLDEATWSGLPASSTPKSAGDAGESRTPVSRPSPPSAGPSEFTMIIQQPAPKPEPVAAAPLPAVATPAASPARRGMDPYVVLAIVFAFILVTSVILILYFVLHR